MRDIAVSVIVPVFNVEKYLDRCLNSLVNQTLKDIEIIIVNDGSPDNSQGIIDRYTRGYPTIIKGYKKENGGLSDARNYGMRLAKGKFIGFVDGDDYVAPSMFEKMYDKAQFSGADIVVCGYYALDEKTGDTKQLQLGNMHYFNQSVLENQNLLFINAPYAWNKIYKRSLFEQTKIEFPKGLIFEDICTIYPLFSCANKIAKVNDCLYYYFRKRNGSITGTYSPRALDVLDSLALLNDFYKSRRIFDSFRKSLLFINIKHIFNRLFEYFEHDNTQFKKDFLEFSFTHLNRYFPGWKKETLYFDIHFKGCYFRKILYKSKSFWKLIAITPVKVISLLRKTKKNLLQITNSSGHRKYFYTSFYKHARIKKKAVLFESFHGTTLSDSPFYLMKELVAIGGYKIYFVTDNYKKHKKYLKRNNLSIKLVKFQSIRYQKLLSSCEFLVNNVSFPSYFIRKDGQHYLNTWHGTPIKTLGKKMSNGIESMHNIQHNLLQATDILFPNEFTRDCIMDDYNLTTLFTGSILVCGYPRNSIFFNYSNGGDIRTELNLDNKQIIAYMPTWRGANSIHVDGRTYADELYEILLAVDDCLNDDQMFFVNLHPILKDAFHIQDFNHVFSFPDFIDNYEFLNICDLLITDYSSVFFDFAISKKPILLFMYDLEKYTAERGFYFDPSNLPFKSAATINDLVRILREIDFNDLRYENNHILRMCHKYESPDTPKQVVDHFFRGIQPSSLMSKKNRAETEISLIRMPKVHNLQQMDDIFNQFRQENSVYAFEKDLFDAELNRILYEKYNEKITYIVTSKQEMCTYLEKVALRNFQSENLLKRIRDRDYKRILPMLTVVKELRPDS